MRTNSKIVYFFIAISLQFFLLSCERNKNDVIPDVYVDFVIDINGDILFRDLNSIGSHAIVTSATNNWGYRSAGFDGNGIIVYCSLPDEYNAYDRTCPHDYVVNGTRVKVNVDFTEAICPVCSTRYALSAFGTPQSGPGRYPLKNYKTRFDGRFLYVWNY